MLVLYGMYNYIQFGYMYVYIYIYNVYTLYTHGLLLRWCVCVARVMCYTSESAFVYCVCVKQTLYIYLQKTPRIYTVIVTIFYQIFLYIYISAHNVFTAFTQYIILGTPSSYHAVCILMYVY